ncbi:alanine racemase [Magnetovirga frankeli]|uniref:alanine racemase n=1 Tax=Magnetovirga frankeli TaxID=947516 RepID=UPI0012941068|nr:alanine racemase [gamma proteobacterium SS-5]
MDFTPKAIIDLAALRHNLALAQRQAPQAQVMAVIKANAYGHGVERVLPALEQAQGLAVARCDEALRLRALGARKPILVMGGAYNIEMISAAAEQGLILAVHHPGQIDLLESLPKKALPRCVPKIDSGMHRLGLLPEQTEAAMARLKALNCLGEQPLLMTHMACADDPTSAMTDRQWRQIQPLLQRYDAQLSAANSALILSRPEMQGNWVRPGIMLYGASPFIQRSGPEVGLRPVMTLQAPLLAVKYLKKGETLGYGATWTLPEDMPVGVVGIGYGDGYPRHAPTGTPVLLNGAEVSLVGRVSMDMITVDLRRQPQARVGDWATLWGRGLAADRIAQVAGTIAYQLFCNLTSRVRVEIHGQG